MGIATFPPPNLPPLGGGVWTHTFCLGGNLAQPNPQRIGNALAISGISLQAVADMAYLNFARRFSYRTRGV